MSKYLEFAIVEEKPKTKVIEISSKTHPVTLGIIKWFPGWRQYCFFPREGTVYSIECLNDIQSYIKDLR